jgi:chromosome segregation ATPase
MFVCLIDDSTSMSSLPIKTLKDTSLQKTDKSKFQLLSDDDIETKDIPAPEKIKEMLAKGEIDDEVRENVTKLSSSQEEIEKELSEARNKQVSTTRKTDESTRMFNLREMQAAEEVNELKKKKQKIQKEIQQILALKNKQLHTDLQKVARFLVTENQKMAPMLKKSFEDGQKNAQSVEKGLQDIDEFKNIIIKMHEDYKEEASSFKKLKEDFAEFSQEAKSFTKNQIEKEKTEQDYLAIVDKKHEVEQKLTELMIGAKEEVAVMQSQKIQLEAELSKLKFEIQQYSVQKQEILKEEHGLHVLREELTSEVDHLQEKLKEASADYEQKFNIIHQYKQEYTKHLRQIEELKAEAAQIQDESNRLIVQKRNKEQEVSFIEVEIKEKALRKSTYELEVDELAHQKSSLQKELHIIEKRNTEVVLSLNHATVELKSAEKSCNQYLAKIDDLKHLVQFEENEVSRIVAEKEIATHSASVAKLDLHELELKKQHRFEEEIELNKKRAQLEKSIAQLEAQVKELEVKTKEKTELLQLTVEKYAETSRAVESISDKELKLISAYEAKEQEQALHLEKLKAMSIYEQTETNKLSLEKAHLEKEILELTLKIKDSKDYVSKGLIEEESQKAKILSLKDQIFETETKLNTIVKTLTTEELNQKSIIKENDLQSQINARLKKEDATLSSNIQMMQAKLKSFDEQKAFYDDKSKYYAEQLLFLEENYRNKSASLDEEYKLNSAKLKIELKALEQKGLQEIHNELEKTKIALHKALDEKKQAIIDVLSDRIYVKRQLDLSSSGSAKTLGDIKTEIKNIFDTFIQAPSENGSSASNFTKIYVGVAVAACAIAAVMWYFK